MITTERLNSVIDHPKIPTTTEEYNRIYRNLRYFSSSFPDVEYLNTNGECQKRKFNHLPLAKTVSKKLASLVFNEQAEISCADETANAFIQDVLLNDRFNKNFERYLESCLALGGLCMRPYVDKNTIKVSFVQAPVFFPLQNNTQDISSSAIVNKTTKVVGKTNYYYTLFEFHEWRDDVYLITNELYKSDRTDIVGDRVPLSELYDDLEEQVTINGLSRPLFTYLKTPGMNNKDINSPLGLSVYDNAVTTIEFINKTFDEFAWEVKMGQRRVAIPEGFTTTIFNETGERLTLGNKFDVEQNVFIKIPNPTQDSFVDITDLTTPIRSNDYIMAINKGLSLFEMQIGVSSGMFSFDGKSMKTATEVVSENSDTYQLRNSIVSLVEQSIKELVISICELGTASGLYHGVIPTLADITVNLDDGVFTDRNVELDYWTKALASNIIGRKYAIKKILGVTDKEAEAIMSDMNDEKLTDTVGVRDKDDIAVYGG